VTTWWPNFGGEERWDDDELPWSSSSAMASSLPSSLPSPLPALWQAWAAACGPGGAFADVGRAGNDVLVAWLNTAGAARHAARGGRALWGAAPDVVAVVHDKAFCADVVAGAGWLPPHLQAAIHVVDAGDVDDARLQALATLPASAQGLVHHGFTAKPRRGSSGRGRVDLRPAARGTLAGALPRLREAGGVIVEPWLPRVVDLAAAWRVHDDGRLQLLGTSQAAVSAGGVWRGCDFVIGDDALPCAPQPRWHELLVAQSRVVVAAAAARGYCGPCGVDAFVFVDRDGVHRLRVVELNARFTAGLVAVVAGAGRAPGTAWRFDPWQGATLSPLPPSPPPPLSPPPAPSG
jgi:hypothetical protein